MSGVAYSRLPTHAQETSPDSHSYPPSSPVRTHHYYPHRWRPRWPRPRSCVKYTVPAVLLLLLLSYLTWEPHVEIALYWRSWIRKEIEPITPLRGCFKPDQVSPSYNVTERLYGPRRTDVHAGMAMRLGLDCYDFAGTIRLVPAASSLAPDRPRTNYHTYWRTDLAPFSERQEYTLKSFFATQNPRHSRLIMWSNGDLSGNALLAGYVARYPDAFELRVADVRELSGGTPLENSPLLESSDEKAWLDGDLIRLLVIWRDGGVWVDMDTLFTRDLTPLLEHEFVTQWDCYGMVPSSSHSFGRKWRTLMPLLSRQNLPTAQRRTHAFPRTLSLPLRGFPSHDDLFASASILHGLGFHPLPTSLASARGRRHPSVQNSPLLLHRRLLMSPRQSSPRPVHTRSERRTMDCRFDARGGRRP